MGTGHPTAVIYHNIHHIHIRPITNIGTSSFVAVTFIPYQPRRVYCRPEAVAFVTLSLTTGICSFRDFHIHHILIRPIPDIGSRSFRCQFRCLSTTSGLLSSWRCHLRHSITDFRTLIISICHCRHPFRDFGGWAWDLFTISLARFGIY